MVPRTLTSRGRFAKPGHVALGVFAAGALLFGASAVHGDGGTATLSHIDTHATYDLTSDAEVSAERHGEILPGDCGCITLDQRTGSAATVAADDSAGAKTAGHVVVQNALTRNVVVQDSTEAELDHDGAQLIDGGEADATAAASVDGNGAAEDNATLDADAALDGSFGLGIEAAGYVSVEGSGVFSGALAIGLTD